MYWRVIAWKKSHWLCVSDLIFKSSVFPLFIDAQGISSTTFLQMSSLQVVLDALLQNVILKDHSILHRTLETNTEKCYGEVTQLILSLFSVIVHSFDLPYIWEHLVPICSVIGISVLLNPTAFKHSFNMILLVSLWNFLPWIQHIWIIYILTKFHEGSISLSSLNVELRSHISYRKESQWKSRYLRL